MLLNEHAAILHNANVGPRLHFMTLEAPQISKTIAPGQFVHMLVPGLGEHVLRRPFSIYDADPEAGTLLMLYQEVGTATRYMPSIDPGLSCKAEIIGPIGNTWLSSGAIDESKVSRALLVGGGVGAAPLFMLAKMLVDRGVAVDVVLGAQTETGLVCRDRYAAVLGREPQCSTDDGSYGRAGFATSLVDERLESGALSDGGAYDYVAVCGPPPLMRIVSDHALAADVACEVSLERRMACGIGACLSCVCDTSGGKRRVCVDGPIFNAREVVW